MAAACTVWSYRSSPWLARGFVIKLARHAGMLQR
jgi:hypothetical protein